MNLSLFLVVLCNLGSLTAFTILSIHFDKWWIMLFALFFYRDIKIVRGVEDDDEVQDL